MSFVNAEEDHVGEKPAYGISGFTKDGKSVVLDHKYDLWLVSLDGSGTPRNLTNGAGAKSDTRFRYVRLEPDDNAPAGGAGGGFGGGGGRGGGGGGTIDLSKPVLLSAFSEQDKKAGFYRLDGDQLTKLRLRGPELRSSDQGEERRSRPAHARNVRRVPRLLGDEQQVRESAAPHRTRIRSRRSSSGATAS